MSFGAKIFLQSLAFMLVIASLTSSLSLANFEDEGRYRALIATTIDEMGKALSRMEANGDAAAYFASAVSLQQKALGESIEIARDHSKNSRFRDFSQPMVKKQLLDLQHLRGLQRNRPPSPLQSAASHSFSRLMCEVLLSLKEDLADCRLPATEEDFASLLVAHHAAVIDMAKVFLIFEEDQALRSAVLAMLSEHQTELTTLRKIL